MYKVRSGLIFRTADSDQHGKWKYDRISLADVYGRWITHRIRNQRTGEDYIDFGNSLLYVKAKITRANGTNLANDAVVGP